MAVFLISLVCLLPLVWWVPYANFTSWQAIFLSIGQITALVGTVLMSLNFVLAARYFWVERIFQGLNKIYVKHHWVGAIAFALLLIHPAVVLMSYAMISMDLAIKTITPSFQNLSVMTGSISLLLMTVLLIMTLFMKLPYHVWKKSHQFLGLSLLFAGVHGFLIGSTLSAVPLLKIYVLGWVAFGLYSAILRLLNIKLNFHNFDYIVSEATVIKDWIIIKMKSVGKSMNYLSGQFLFLTVYAKGITRETHPFSIASKSNEDEVLVVAKSLGDYTETLKLLKSGENVKIEGAYGQFNYHFGKNRKQIWVAGGIGVTPFRGMALEVAEKGDAQVIFFYTVRKASEALFDSEFKLLKSKNLSYELWLVEKKGKITADKIKNQIGDIKSVDIFICGPVPLMRSLAEQFVKLGVKPGRIHTEEFGLY